MNVIPPKRFKYLNETNQRIDLDNFESSEFVNSKYILTSPRSLEACSRLRLKPAELVHKSMVDIEDELTRDREKTIGVSTENLPLWLVYEEYSRQENARRGQFIKKLLSSFHQFNQFIFLINIYSIKSQTGQSQNGTSQANQQCFNCSVVWKSTKQQQFNDNK